MFVQLIDFQQTALTNITTTLKTHNSVLLQSATASGKTVIGSAYIKQQVKQKQNVLVLVPLQNLVTQFYATLLDFGILSSVLHDEITRDKKGNLFVQDWKNPVQITMPVTFINTVNGNNKLPYSKQWQPDVVVIDEAHKGTSTYYQTIKAMFPNAKILGLTATPHRDLSLEGECLTEWYGDRLITTISVRDLIAIGRLVQPYYYEFQNDSHVVNTWLMVAKDKRTIIFTRDTLHSFAIKEAFENEGIRAEVITAGSELDPDNIVASQTPLQRQKIYNDFEKGSVKILISVNALCEGFDCPQAEVCMLLRTVGNHALYHQMVGRVLRAFLGKLSAMVMDFGDNIKSYGHIEDYQWSLEPVELNISYIRKDSHIGLENYLKKTSVYYTCHACNHVYNIKQNHKCNQCETKHNITIKTTAFDMLRKYFILTDNKELEQFRSRFKAAKSIDIAREVFNKRVGHNVFDIKTGEVQNKFKFIEPLLDVKNGGDFVAINFLDNDQISVTL